MRLGRRAQQIGIILVGQPGDERVGRYPVGAFGEERLAVAGEVKALAPLIGLAHQAQLPQADLSTPVVEGLARLA